MPYTPKYSITNSILKNVGAIDSAREVITHAPLVPAWERRFQSEARTKIIHHGTHLEGNDLNLEEVEEVLNPPTDSESTETESPKLIARDRDIQEVINYRSVMDYLDSLATTDKDNVDIPLTRHILQEIHSLTVKNLLPANEAGHYRIVKVVIRKFLILSKSSLLGSTPRRVKKYTHSLGQAFSTTS